MADHVPDPSRSYERAKPEAESGMGRLDNNDSTLTNQPDRLQTESLHCNHCRP